jgi:predicted amidohydrolase YtcJ
MLLRNAVVARAGRTDVRMEDGHIAAIGPGLDGPEGLDCGGGVLLPGLHDHHIHLLAAAAALSSVECGPPLDRPGLVAALRAGRATGWIRGVGYHESVAGSLDRRALDEIRSDVPIRVQHASGALWMVNSRAADALDLERAHAAGVERDADGRPTGRLWRMDGWLRARVPPYPADLGLLSGRLARYGITGVTDATPQLDQATAALLRSGVLRQRVYLLGAPSELPMKIVLPDHRPVLLDEVADAIRAARPRPVAVHCVTRTALVLLLAALREVGPVRGDRIEHAAVAPPEAIREIRRLGVAVVTQPSLPYRRGERYLADAEPWDRPWLWPYRSLLAAGIPVACSSDAPYGDLDPWVSIAAAARRRTAAGTPIGPREAVSAQQALRGYLGSPGDPGGPHRTVCVGGPADLVLLDAPLGQALAAPSKEHVAATIIGGQLGYARNS